MKLHQEGFGVYLMPPEWRKMPNPKVIKIRVLGSLGNEDWEKVATLLILFSVYPNLWVGVKRSLLLERIRNCAKSDEEKFDRLVKSIDEMIKERLLKVSGFFEVWWLRWLNRFIWDIICPTKLLIEKIQEHQEVVHELKELAN